MDRKQWIVILELIDRAPDVALEIDEAYIRQLIADNIGPELPPAVGYQIRKVEQVRS